MSGSGRFLAWFGTTCLGILIAGAALNYAIDPAHIFRLGSYEREVAKILSSDRHVANVTNYDDRLLQVYYTELVRVSKDIVVLGSSRSMQIGASLYPRRSLFNHSVTSARIEDFLAIVEMLTQREILPKTIVIGVDPWIFNANNRGGYWKSFSRYLLGMQSRLGITCMPSAMKNADNPRFHELISLDYLRESLSVLVSRLRSEGEDKYFAVDDDNTPLAIKRSDGSLKYPLHRLVRSVGVVRAEAIHVMRTRPHAAISNFIELDNCLTQVFESLISYLQSKEISVEIVLPPYHPAAYRVIVGDNQYHTVLSAEAYLKDLSEEFDFPIYGSYSPVNLGCTDEEFVDAYHPKIECFQKFLLDNKSGK